MKPMKRFDILPLVSFAVPFGVAFGCVLLTGCSGEAPSAVAPQTTNDAAAGTGASTSASSGGATTTVPGDGVGNGGSGLNLGSPDDAPDRTVGHQAPEITGMTAAESGAYKRGDKLADLQPGSAPDVTGGDGCGALVGVVRDFKTRDPGRHPDFEAFSGAVVSPRLVGPELDADRKPVYASKCETDAVNADCPSGRQSTSKAAFDQWYRDAPDVNQSFLLYIKMEPTGEGNVVSFRSENFMPMDGAGWNDMWGGTDGKQHNFGFTTELHIKFKYSGGESFTFKGDDDVWAFINGKLAMDLGGLHEAREDTIHLDDLADELGLVKGNIYPLELFQAERHSAGSHFRLDSTLAVVDCGSIPEVPR